MARCQGHRLRHGAHRRQAAEREVLKKALAAGVPLKKLFNTSGESYKAGNFKDKLPAMTEAEAVKALAADGKLIKRPFVVAGDVVLTGFDEEAWQAELA